MKDQELQEFLKNEAASDQTSAFQLQQRLGAVPQRGSTTPAPAARRVPAASGRCQGSAAAEEPGSGGTTARQGCAGGTRREEEEGDEVRREGEGGTGRTGGSSRSRARDGLVGWWKQQEPQAV